MFDIFQFYSVMEMDKDMIFMHVDNKDGESFSVKIIKFQTQIKFAVITLKVEQDGFSIE